jgi:hypothetical protein
MTATQSFDRERQDQVLLDSIRQQRQLVLTQNAAEGWQTFKAVFHLGSPESGDLSVRMTPEEGEPVTRALTTGVTLGGTFRLGHKKCMFSTSLREVRAAGDHAVARLAWPQHLQQLQRRAYERAAPPQGTIVPVRFWREIHHEEAARDPRVVRHGQLEDLSCGGIRIKVSDTQNIDMNCTYRCVFAPRPGKPAMVLDGILRHREAAEHGRASLGLQFVGMETSVDGLRSLDRLARVVSHFQRSHGRPRKPSPVRASGGSQSS